MNLLTKSPEEFRTATFWEDFFKKRKDAFEWYGDYNDLSDIFERYCKIGDDILVTGCGNSKLSEDLYDVGYRNISNIDISEVVIDKMIKKNTCRPAMSFKVMDIMKMDFKDDTYNVILDKATLDSIFINTSQSHLKNVQTYFGEVKRVLKVGGRYICISLAQEHIAQELVTSFKDGWIVRVHKQSKVPESGDKLGMPVFIFVMTKMKINLPVPIIEMALNAPGKFSKVNVDEATRSIKDAQNYYILERKLGSTVLEDDVTIDLWSDTGSLTQPRYSVTVVDLPLSTNLQGDYGVFIVPQGQESKWLFSTKRGRRELAEEVKFRRLAIASLHRGHKYTSMEEIKEELSNYVMQFAPPKMASNIKVPFLTASEDIGWREVLFQGTSETMGDYAVEDVLTEDQIYCRRLIFKSGTASIQTEVALLSGSKGKKGKRVGLKEQNWKDRKFDFSKISEYYQYLVTAMWIIRPINEEFRVLLLGLGGGCLANFLCRAFKEIKLTCIELESEIISAAKKWFGFVEDENNLALPGDGVEYMRKQIEQGMTSHFHVIIVDVNAKICEFGISAPPKVFLTPETLKMYETLLHPEGALLINVLSGEDDALCSVIEEIKGVFKIVYKAVVPELLNHVVMCFHGSRSQPISNELLVKAAEDFQRHTTQNKPLRLDFSPTDIIKEFKEV